MLLESPPVASDTWQQPFHSVLWWLYKIYLSFWHLHRLPLYAKRVQTSSCRPYEDQNKDAYPRTLWPRFGVARIRSQQSGDAVWYAALHRAISHETFEAFQPHRSNKDFLSWSLVQQRQLVLLATKWMLSQFHRCSLIANKIILPANSFWKEDFVARPG